MSLTTALFALTLISLQTCLAQTAPFEPDDHTRLLYHFDEGHGTVVHDASGFGNHAQLRGPRWVAGRHGMALWFDGRDDCVFREVPESIRGLRQITLEAWIHQEDASGRRFIAGQDVGFHFEVDDGIATSVSLYNEGGSVLNSEGKAHQQCFAMVGTIRTGRWHHIAITYNGETVSHFVDGVLKARNPGPRDFSLGAPSRGLWIGCYVGMDYWFSGTIDEFRVSDCVRYDAQQQLAIGGRAFDMPQPITRPLCRPREVRQPTRSGEATLALTIRKRHGAEASGWVYLKPPGRPAVIVGQYAVTGPADGPEAKVECDVSDELSGEGTYLVGLEHAEASGYIALTRAQLLRGGQVVGTWEGQALSRRTFNPPLLVPIQVGEAPAAARADLQLLPATLDRAWGSLELDNSAQGQPPLMVGDGYAEWWVHVPTRQAYRVHLRFTGRGRPCDIVIDGDDLNEFNMCATTGWARSQAMDALFDYQGSVTLDPGAHWIRVQDVLPDIVALWFQAVEAEPRPKVPWDRFPVPDGTFLAGAGDWEVEPYLGRPQDAWARLETAATEAAMRFAATFANTDPGTLFAGDCVRLVHRGAWDLEPFGRLTFRFEGQGTGHVVSLWLIDAKGDEKLLWRTRDMEAGLEEISVPLSFEGNDVFDPGHVVAVALELDEGNFNPEQVNRIAGAIIGPHFQRRDVIVAPQGHAGALAAARQRLEAVRRELAADAAPLLSPGFRPWTRPVMPEEHPLFPITQPPPVTRRTLGYQLHFTGARDISPAALDMFHNHYDFGDICWPHIGIIPLRRNYGTDQDYWRALCEFERRLEAVRDRGLIVWDIWGYVPHDEAGTTPVLAPEHLQILLRVFGDRFLGFDNGEQDGRYIGSYADRGPHTNRREGWEDFVKWDEAICRDSLYYMNATGSLNFSHYYGERAHRTLGLETAQGLPSDTLMFAFLRGASKQYGRLTTQATSIWNRFGYNMYHDRRTDGPNGYGLGPHKGCSLSLHRRLFFQSYTGGDSIVGTETSQFTADQLENGAPELSPLGRQHLELYQWVREHPDRGVMYTPVAFMLDFYNGWNMPRHLYRSDKYKIWGKLPYEKGDYLIDALFRMIWPGYEDCSYLRNERGFICPTPFGDIFDVLTNRCHLDILRQYTAIMLLGEVEMTPEVVANLTAFVQEGGDLILDARQAQSFPPVMTGVTCGEPATGLTSSLLASGQEFDEQPYTYTVLTLTTATPLLVNESRHPLMTVNAVGKGRVIVGAVDMWMTDKLTYQAPELVNMEPPYTLLHGVQAALRLYFRSFSPVTVDPGGLNVRTCCFENDPGRLLVALTNNELFADWQGSVQVRVGEVASVRELWRGAPVAPGPVLQLTVPAGDVAVLDVRLR